MKQIDSRRARIRACAILTTLSVTLLGAGGARARGWQALANLHARASRGHASAGGGAPAGHSDHDARDARDHHGHDDRDAREASDHDDRDARDRDSRAHQDDHDRDSHAHQDDHDRQHHPGHRDHAGPGPDCSDDPGSEDGGTGPETPEADAGSPDTPPEPPPPSSELCPEYCALSLAPSLACDTPADELDCLANCGFIADLVPACEVPFATMLLCLIRADDWECLGDPSSVFPAPDICIRESNALNACLLDPPEPTP